jgi:hypothetical protein
MRAKKKSLISHRFGYSLLLAIILLTAMIFSVPMVHAENPPQSMLLYKSPTCGCCTAWVDHMKDEGFSTIVKHPQNLNAIKKQLNITVENQACHTGILQGYVFEGHIPANVIQQFLADRPSDVIGLAVPGMPMGSPGMDNGRAFNPYQVFQLNQDGSRTPYATISFDKTVFMENDS